MEKKKELTHTFSLKLCISGSFIHNFEYALLKMDYSVLSEKNVNILLFQSHEQLEILVSSAFCHFFKLQLYNDIYCTPSKLTTTDFSRKMLFYFVEQHQNMKHFFPRIISNNFFIDNKYMKEIIFSFSVLCKFISPKLLKFY